MRVENAGHPVLEHDGVVGHPRQLIVDVAKAVRHLLADQVELAPRQPPDHVALRHHDAPEAGDVALDRQDVADQRVGRLLDHLLLDFVEPLFELIHLGAIVIDHGVDDAMQQRDRALGEDVVGAAAQLADMRDAAPLAIMNGDEKVLNVFTSGVPFVWASMDHQMIVWHHSFIKVFHLGLMHALHNPKGSSDMVDILSNFWVHGRPGMIA